MTETPSDSHQDEADTGVALSTALGQLDAGGRARCDPAPRRPTPLDFLADTP